MPELTHFDEQGRSRMVDVSQKEITRRRAVASGVITMHADTRKRILDRDLKKGDVIEVARLAGIMAVKRTADLIPLCHPLPVEKVSLDFEPVAADQIKITAEVEVHARTGVEMEALTAVSVAALTVYDMCKSIDRAMTLGPTMLVEKSGGRSGDFRAE